MSIGSSYPSTEFGWITFFTPSTTFVAAYNCWNFLLLGEIALRTVETDLQK